MYVSPNVVVGFHGCDQVVFDKVIKRGENLSKSENAYDWLGNGIYFWEGSYDRALQWAKSSRKVRNPAVIGAFIKLGVCIDLLDSADLKKVQSAYEILKKEFNKLGLPLPENRVKVGGISFIRELDCKVILRLQQLNNELIAKNLGLSDTTGPRNKRKIQKHHQFIDSVRGMFPEGDELYNGAGFRAKNHIQLCIVNPNCIIGYFDPTQIQNNHWYKTL